MADPKSGTPTRRSVTIRTCNLTSEDYVVISCSSNFYIPKFLVDSQAEISIIKKFSLKDDAIINNNNIVNIIGVTEGSVQSLGTINSLLNISEETEIDIEFAVVPDSFPIPTDGIIGKDFLKQK